MHPDHPTTPPPAAPTPKHIELLRILLETGWEFEPKHRPALRAVLAELDRLQGWGQLLAAAEVRDREREERLAALETACTAALDYLLVLDGGDGDARTDEERELCDTLRAALGANTGEPE